MKRLAIAVFILNFASANESRAQSSIPTPRVQTRQANALDVKEDSIRKNGDTEQSIFGAAGLSVRPLQNPQFNLEANVVRVAVFGRPDSQYDPVTKVTTYKEHIAYAFNLNSYVIDAVGSLTRGVREYLVSKKGSPVSINLPGWNWNTKRGDVRQFWMAGQIYGEAKAIPLADSNQDFLMNGTVGAGYTQQANIDLLVGDDPGNIFFEASIVGAGMLGKDLIQNLDADSDKSLAGVAGVDWRVGLQILGSAAHAISLSGTTILTKVQGRRATVSVGYSKSIR